MTFFALSQLPQDGSNQGSSVPCRAGLNARTSCSSRIKERQMNMATCGGVLVKLLEGYGVEQVFGIPGVHTVELYRGLARSSINHVTPRHEQGAGFMADGYARTSGKPGVCFIITGPGMTNITTAMGQAYADSIPMLVISSVQSRSHSSLITLATDLGSVARAFSMASISST